MLGVRFSSPAPKKGQKMTKPKQSKKQRLEDEKRKHEKFLRRVGYKPRSERPEINIPPKTIPESNQETQSYYKEKDLRLMGTPCIRKNKNNTNKTYTVSIAYNKGPYMVIPEKEIKNIGR